MKYVATFLAAAVLGSLSAAVRADLLVMPDGSVRDGKLISQDPKEFVWQSTDNSANERISRSTIARIVVTDEKGAATAIHLPTPASAASAAKWNIPAPPAAPPVVAVNKPSYYVIPLHGEVGNTILASVLEQSLDDAAARKASIVVLDIDSPGGLVEESKKIIKVLHKYNKTLTIVALTDQDLSAAAIFTLSVRHIYVKSSSTLGAATSYTGGGFVEFSPKVEEKMQSAWRAVARNSAEEGEHEPILADAMIDNDVVLHLENVGGKKTVKEGPGDKMLSRKGHVLTLTSREAVACGLADGQAEDLKELGEALDMKNWTECKGLGTLLADYLPKKNAAFTRELERIILEGRRNWQDVEANDPGTSKNARMLGVLPADVPPAFRERLQNELASDWNQRSLVCVLAAQNTERNLADAVELCQAFGQDGRAESFRTSLDSIAQLRADMYANRDKYKSVKPSAASQPAIATLTPTVGPVVSPRVINTQPSATTAWPAPTTGPAPHPAFNTVKDRIDARNKFGYAPFFAISPKGLEDPKSIDEAIKMLQGPQASATAAALWLCGAPFDSKKQKEVIKTLTPLLDATDEILHVPAAEAIAVWATSEDVPLLVKILKTADRPTPHMTPDGSDLAWGPAAYALLKIDPATLAKLLPERNLDYAWYMNVHWVLMAAKDQGGPDADIAQRLLDLSVEPPMRPLLGRPTSPRVRIPRTPQTTIVMGNITVTLPPVTPTHIPVRPPQETPQETHAKRGYSPTVVPARPGLKSPASIQEATTMLKSSKDGEPPLAAAWLRDTAFDDSEHKKVIEALTPLLNEPDARKRAPFVEALATWAGPEEVPLLVKQLQSYDKGQDALHLDGNARCWAPAAYALVYLDPGTLGRMIPEKKADNQWRVNVFWVLQAVSEQSGPQAEIANRLTQLTHGEPATKPH